ncbi:phospholipase A1-like [Sergentomyia squamirostris]
MKVLILILLFLLEVFSIAIEPETKIKKRALASEEEDSFNLQDVEKDQLLKGRRDFQANKVVSFTLYTRSAPKQVIGLVDAKSLSSSNFNASHPTRLIIHGWFNNGNFTIQKIIQEAYHLRGDFNVFIVDWSEGALDQYAHAASRIDSVGKTVADFLIFLRKETGIRLSDVTVIGHSMGAHIAGVAGRNVAKVEELGVIIGLDPALPMFFTFFALSRLNTSDARYVETIHTNTNGLGIGPPVGTASFYPNFGKWQPACGVDFAGVCSHILAPVYFAESITSDKGFWARRCQGYDDIINKSCKGTGEVALMGGEPSNIRSEGVYWLETNSITPFAKGKL